jgi:hypothetical protein
MSLYEIAVLLGFSIVIALVIGIVRFKKIAVIFYPFVYVIGLGFVNHLLNIFMVSYFRTNAVNGNIYVLLEVSLYQWLFVNWGLFKKRNLFPLMITVTLIFSWLVDNLMIHSLQTPNAGFRILSSLLVVILSVEQIVRLLPNAKGNILYNAFFIICTGLILHFSFKACVEVFFLIQKDVPITLQVTIYSVLIYVNCFVNLLFAWAMICIPRKQQYLLLY